MPPGSQAEIDRMKDKAVEIVSPHTKNEDAANTFGEASGLVIALAMLSKVSKSHHLLALQTVSITLTDDVLANMLISYNKQMTANLSQHNFITQVLGLWKDQTIDYVKNKLLIMRRIRESPVLNLVLKYPEAHQITEWDIRTSKWSGKKVRGFLDKIQTPAMLERYPNGKAIAMEAEGLLDESERMLGKRKNQQEEEPDGEQKEEQEEVSVPKNGKRQKLTKKQLCELVEQLEEKCGQFEKERDQLEERCHEQEQELEQKRADEEYLEWLDEEVDEVDASGGLEATEIPYPVDQGEIIASDEFYEGLPEILDKEEARLDLEAEKVSQEEQGYRAMTGLNTDQTEELEQQTENTWQPLQESGVAVENLGNFLDDVKGFLVERNLVGVFRKFQEVKAARKKQG